MKKNGRVERRTGERERGRGRWRTERRKRVYRFFRDTYRVEGRERGAQDKCLPVVRPLLSRRFSLINDRRSFRFNDLPPGIPFLAPGSCRSFPSSRCLSSVLVATVTEFLGFASTSEFSLKGCCVLGNQPVMR